MIHLFNGYYMAADKSSYTVGKAEESRSKRFFKPGASITLPLLLPWLVQLKSHSVTKSRRERSRRYMMPWKSCAESRTRSLQPLATVRGCSDVQALPQAPRPLCRDLPPPLLPWSSRPGALSHRMK